VQAAYCEVRTVAVREVDERQSVVACCRSGRR
jgi:hypothetical protein